LFGVMVVFAYMRKISIENDLTSLSVTGRIVKRE
jgi:hypothetical protein